MCQRRAGQDHICRRRHRSSDRHDEANAPTAHWHFAEFLRRRYHLHPADVCAVNFLGKALLQTGSIPGQEILLLTLLALGPLLGQTCAPL